MDAHNNINSTESFVDYVLQAVSLELQDTGHLQQVVSEPFLAKFAAFDWKTIPLWNDGKQKEDNHYRPTKTANLATNWFFLLWC